MQNNIYKTLSALAIVLIASISIYLFVLKNKNAAETAKNIDQVQRLKETNPDFKAGADALASGNTQAAINSFAASKNSAETSQEQAISQYNLAGAKMADGQRYPAIDEYLKIINDETVSPSLRSLAMNQVFLFYKSYSDINILNQAFGKQDISKLAIEDAEYAYVMKAYNLHPFAITIPKIMFHEMSSVNSADEVQAIYNKYLPAFNKSIVEMGASSGQEMYVVNALLGKAKIMMIMQKYNLIVREEIEKTIETAYQRAKDLRMTNTDQFALLEYANYESSIGDTAKADALISILSKPGLSSMLKENLSAAKAKTAYPALLKLKLESKSTTTQAFFKTINW